MAKIDLHKFRDDLRKKPPKGSNQPPVGIRAQDLDDNFRKVTLLADPRPKPSYKVKYTPNGTIITDIKGLPDNALAKQFTICENGEPVQYWFLVWENEPELD